MWQPVTPTESETQVCFCLGTLQSRVVGSGVEFLSLLRQQCPTAYYVLSINGQKNQAGQIDVIACTTIPPEVVSALLAKVQLNFPDFTASVWLVKPVKDKAGNTIGVSSRLWS